MDIAGCAKRALLQKGKFGLTNQEFGRAHRRGQKQPHLHRKGNQIRVEHHGGASEEHRGE